MPNARSAQRELAQTACGRCREQKLKCSREQPRCARCVKFDAPCSYPEPPDRKMIAIRRECEKRRAAESIVEADNESSPHRSTRVRVDSSGTSYDGSQQDSLSPRSQHRNIQPQELSNSIQKQFQKRYFDCIFISSLTFCRPTFEAGLQNGKIHEHTMLAMYALAAQLSAPLVSSKQESASELRRLGDLVKLGDKWAIQAGKMMLQSIDLPTLSAVQTCQILTFYWFSRGDTKRNVMFSGIGYRAVRTLVLDAEAAVPPILTKFDHVSDSERTRRQELESMRRCFWASWLTNCVVSDQYAIGGAADTQVLAMPLPVSESAFVQGKLEEPETLREFQKRLDTAPRGQTNDAAREPSIMAETMKIILLWARTRDLIETRRTQPEKESWYKMFPLQDALANWIKQLPPSLTYSKRNLYEQLVVREHTVFIFLHTIYHQCCLVLHSSLVPHFSGTSLPQESMPPQVARISAEIALSHAQALSELGADLLSLDWPPSQIAPFVGYSMYVASTVHLTILVRDSELAEAARRHLASSLKLLKRMKSSWAILEKLWRRFHQLYASEMAKHGVHSMGSTPSAASTNLTRTSGMDDQNIPLSETNGDDDLRKESVSFFGLGKAQDDSTNGATPLLEASILNDIIDSDVEEPITHILNLQNPISSSSTLSHVPAQQQGMILQPVTALDGDSQNLQKLIDIPPSQSIAPIIGQNPQQQQLSMLVHADPFAPLIPTYPIEMDEVHQFDGWWQMGTSDPGQIPFPFNDMFGMENTFSQ